MLIGAANSGEVGNVFVIFAVSLNRTITQAQGEGSIRWLVEASLGKAGFRDARALEASDRVHVIIVGFAYRAGLGIDVAHQHDQRVSAGLYRGCSTVPKLAADGDILELGIRDDVARNLVGRLSIQNLSHRRVLRAKLFLHLGERIG